MKNNQNSYIQGKLSEIEDRKRELMEEIRRLDKRANMLRLVLHETRLPVVEPCGMELEEFTLRAC